MMTWTKIKTVAAAAVLLVSLTGGAVMVATTLAQQPAQSARGNAPAPPATAPFDPEAARETILLRFHALQNFSVSYRVDVSLMPSAAPATARATPPATMSAGRVLTVGGPLENYLSERFLSRLGERLYEVEERPIASQGNQPSTVKTAIATSGDVLESLTERTQQNQTTKSGRIDVARATTSTLVEWALGLGSSRGLSGRLNAADILAMDIVPAANGNVILRQTAESKTIMEWEFQPDMGYALVAYRAIVQPVTHANVDVVAEDFKTVQGLQLPYTIKMRLMPMVNGQRIVSQRQTATIKEYKLNDPQNTEQRYHIQWPEEAQVVDSRSQQQFVADANGKLIGIAEADRAKYKTLVQEAVAPTDWSARTTFAPAMSGLVVAEYRRQTKGSMLDLDTGQLVDRPPMPAPPTGVQDVARYNLEKQALRQKIREAGADLAFTFTPDNGTNSGWGMFMLDSVLTALPAEAWEKPDRSLLRASFAAGEIGGVRVTTSPDVGVLLGPELKLPLIFAYHTREGGIGMMRITKFESAGTVQATVDVMKLK